MTLFHQRLFVSGADEVADYHAKRITHLISVSDAGGAFPVPSWFMGKHLRLCFGDVESEADAKRLRTKAPTTEDVRSAVEFFRSAWRAADSRTLVSCEYGASRSPALAYVCVADQMGVGRESEALELIVKIRPNAIPNRLVVQLGDMCLERDGALLEPLRRFYSKLNEEISKWKKPG